ncbi:MAG TPA: hypothetical protein VGO57_14220 [Verrucomicrobiae bacterium]|jgi:hypothetical protein
MEQQAASHVMYTGITGQIRKTAFGRFMLHHVNTGLFWLYGIMTFALAFSLSGYWIHNGWWRCLISLPFALIAAFTFSEIVYAFFWRRFRNGWINNYVLFVLYVSFLLSEFFHHQRGERISVVMLIGQILIPVCVFANLYVIRRKEAEAKAALAAKG